MSCDHVRQLISEGYDRRLSPAERQSVAQHLRTCAACARFELALRAGLEQVTRLPEIAPSPELWEAVHTQSALEPGMTPARVARQVAGMLGAALAVGLVTALTIFIFHNHGTTTTGNRPEIAAGMLASPTVLTDVTTALAQQSPFVAAASPTPSVQRSATPSPSQTAPLITTATPMLTPAMDEKTAAATVVGYFHAINLQDYVSAYGYLGSDLQQQQTLAEFTSGYAGTDHDTLTITASKPDDSGNVVIMIFLDAKQADGSTRHYHGQYVVGYEHDQAKIVDATVIEDVAAAPTATPGAPARNCAAKDLSATADYQGATGSMAGAIVFTNKGADSCVLEGIPQVQILGASGQVLTTAQRTMSIDGSSQPVTLMPGQQASLFFLWSNWCPPGTGETSAASPIAGGDSFRVTLVDTQETITAPARHANGDPASLVPRCDAPGNVSTLSVGAFEDYPPQ